jgi:hypothetical protein
MTTFFEHRDHKKNPSGEAAGFVSAVVEARRDPGEIGVQV